MSKRSDNLINLTLIDFLMQIIVFGLVYFAFFYNEDEISKNRDIANKINEMAIKYKIPVDELIKYTNKLFEKYGKGGLGEIIDIPTELIKYVNKGKLAEVKANEERAEKLGKSVDDILTEAEKNATRLYSCLDFVNGNPPVIMSVKLTDEKITITNKTEYFNQLPNGNAKEFLGNNPQFGYEQLGELRDITGLKNKENNNCRFYVRVDDAQLTNLKKYKAFHNYFYRNNK